MKIPAPSTGLHRCALLLLAVTTAIACAQTQQDWPTYNGAPDNDHYSPLTQINRTNVTKLRPAWTFDTSETGGIQTNPLIIGHTLYGYTPSQKIFALNAATGQRLWLFDSGIASEQPNRGLAYWTDGQHPRLLASVVNFLYALDPASGKPIPTFGENGRIDLRKLLGRDSTYQQQMVVMTTPGVVYRDLIIVGFRTSEESPAPPGDIRAFNVRTGALVWSFHTIPHPGEFGYETWPPDAWKTIGSANNWSGMSLDQQRGIVYVPTGSPVSDFYGADRKGGGLFGDTLLALDAATGKRLWHFQAVHHDIWDRDFPTPPALVTLHRNGQAIDAIAQPTKQGYLYLFDRVTGKPIFPIEEKPYPASTVPGEQSSPTQPLPTEPAPFARQQLTADMLTTRTPQAHEQAMQQFSTFRSEGQFIPLSVDKQTIIFPGFDGGAEWGGPAVDPKTAILYVNANDIAWTGGLTPNQTASTPGEQIYKSSCAACHGDDRRGSPPAFPSLTGITDRLTEAQITATIQNGKGRMPSFPSLTTPALAQLLAYLKTDATPSTPTNTAPQAGYRFTGYRKFLDSDNYPAVAPPWGTLNAIDLNTGKYLWKIPFGEYPELSATGMVTGSENYGGPVVTAGGLLFIGATIYDNKLRAFNSQTGQLLWEYKLPFAGLATPSVYMADGKEYIVIAAAGGRNPKQPAGGLYIAFSLP